MPDNVEADNGRGDWTFCPMACAPARCDAVGMSDALPQHIPGHDARHGSTDHSAVHPGEIAIGVIIGRASENFDFFVYGIASVLVFPAVFFPFAPALQATLYAFTIFAFAFIARPFGSIAF